MNALQTRIPFLTVVFLTSIRAQILYETDYQQYSSLNRESKEVSVQSLLGETEALLKKMTSDLQKLVDKEDAYNDLMMMYSQGQIPNGEILIRCIRFRGLGWGRFVIMKPSIRCVAINFVFRYFR